MALAGWPALTPSARWASMGSPAHAQAANALANLLRFDGGFYLVRLNHIHDVLELAIFV